MPAKGARPPEFRMPDIPILPPARISSGSRHHGLIFRIRVEDMMMRPIGSDSHPNMRGDLRGDLRGNLRGDLRESARRSLTNQHLRRQREHNTRNNTLHFDSRRGQRRSSGKSCQPMSLPPSACLFPAALPFCRCGTPRNKVTRVLCGYPIRFAFLRWSPMSALRCSLHPWAAGSQSFGSLSQPSQNDAPREPLFTVAISPHLLPIYRQSLISHSR